jgi:O-methyltransferase
MEEFHQFFFEFGCHSGRTFATAMNSAYFLDIRECQFFAFDSFEGLPETNSQDGIFKEGTFLQTKRTLKKSLRKKLILSYLITK